MTELTKTISALALAGLLLSPAALAQDDEAGEDNEQEEIRRYTVEVIVFSYTEDFGVGTEEFYPDDTSEDERDGLSRAELDLVDEVDVPATRPGIDLVTYAANRDVLKLVPLAEDEYTLTDVVDRFELLDAYETMMHFGWTQPTLPPEYTRPVSLHAFGNPPQGLDGNFRLYLSRYLHLVVDLALAAATDDEPARFGLSAPGFGDPRLRYDAFGNEYLAPVYYRIQEDRIFKNGEIRYFDHPKYGIVAKVTRVEEEPEEPAEPEPLLSGTGQ